jgi:hypothetical protein
VDLPSDRLVARQALAACRSPSSCRLCDSTPSHAASASVSKRCSTTLLTSSSVTGDPHHLSLHHEQRCEPRPPRSARNLVARPRSHSSGASLRATADVDRRTGHRRVISRRRRRVRCRTRFVRIVVDTGVFSAALSRRRRSHFETHVERLAGNQLFLASATVAELRFGALVAEWGSSRRRRRRSDRGHDRRTRERCSLDAIGRASLRVPAGRPPTR